MINYNAESPFNFKPIRQLKDNYFAIALIIRVNKRRIVNTLNISAKIEQWDSIEQKFYTKEIIKSSEQYVNSSMKERKKLLDTINPLADDYNIVINQLKIDLQNQVNDYIRRKIPFTAEMLLKSIYKKTKSRSVEKYLLTTITELEQKERIGTARTYKDLYKYLLRFDSNFSSKHFPDINYDYVVSFFEYEKKRGREIGGIGVSLRALRSLLNNAIKENVGSPETYPFSNQYGTNIGKDTFELYRNVKTVTRKRFIPIEYLQKFYNYKFKSVPHQRSQALFFFSFFCGGINFSDMAKLKQSDIKHSFNKKGEPIEYFIYTRQKTKEIIEIQLNEDIKNQIKILQLSMFKRFENYLLPIITTSNLSPIELSSHIINKRKKLNKYLKEMAEIMEFPTAIQDLSSYFARHSFAMRLRTKGHSIDEISAALHHANTEITKVYLESFGADDVAKISQGLLH